MSLLEEIRNAKRKIHNFPYEVGDDTFDITVQQFLPGTAIRKRQTALMKLHQVIKTEAVPLSEMTDEDFTSAVEKQDERMAILNQDFCECVIDAKTYRPYLSVEEAEELFTVDFKQECVDFAMGGASPTDEDNLSEEEEFPTVSDGSEEK